MKTALSAFVALGMIPAWAAAHYSQRVWVDVDSTGKIQTEVGPPGSSPAPYSAAQFSDGKVFARDLGGQDDVAYTTLQGGALASDGDDDDDGVNYQSNFPGYEATPFPATNFSGTFGVSFVGQPLYYKPGTGGAAGHFVSVSTAFAGQVLPYFSISSVVADSAGNQTVQSANSPTDNSTVYACAAFTVGSHAHPAITLHPNPENGDYTGPGDDVTDSDQYDGIYAVRLELTAPGYTASDPFYLILGKNEPLSEIAQAGIVAESTLVPEPASIGLIAVGTATLLRRRR